MINKYPAFLDQAAISTALNQATTEDSGRIKSILAQATDPARARFTLLPLADVAALMSIKSHDLLSEMFEAAKAVKQRVYGNRIVFFAPLYFSNECVNECLECAFRKSNHELVRRTLSQDQIRDEIKALVNSGQKRVLLIGGEDTSNKGFEQLVETVHTIYGVHEPHGGEIWRVNVNVAPLTVDRFRELNASGIGTYQLFQETYDEASYKTIHLKGPKANFEWRLFAMHRAMEAGIGDIGMGVQLGLFDWRHDTLAMLQHIGALEKEFGIGCHTISVPRTEPALGSEMSQRPPNCVSDDDFKKLVAILRLAVPYTGIIMSTRESPEMRAQTLRLGVSQMSGGSHTEPGGYANDAFKRNAQFVVSDQRSLDQVIGDTARAGYLPSFCVGCEKKGRMGDQFVPFAQKGIIHQFCTPNAIVTAQEYAERYASPKTRAAIEAVIETEMERVQPRRRASVSRQIIRIKHGDSPTFY